MYVWLNRRQSKETPKWYYPKEEAVEELSCHCKGRGETIVKDQGVELSLIKVEESPLLKV